MKIGFNGKIMDAMEAVISVFDHGFLYGIGLFETFRTYRGKPYLLGRHLERMRMGCNQLGIPFHLDEEQLEAWLAKLLHANGLEDGYVRLTVSAGNGELGLPMNDYTSPSIVLMVKPLPAYTHWDQNEIAGKELRLMRTKRNTPEAEVRMKSLHFMNNLLAKRELEAVKHIRLNRTAQSYAVQQALAAAGGVEGLLLNAQGMMTEGIVSNVFFVKDNHIYTPAVDTGILPGITRARVIELADKAGYSCSEGYYRWGELLAADEIWLTNSIQELVPVTVLTDSDGNSSLGSSSLLEDAYEPGRIGLVTRNLLKAYQQDTVL